jgi:WXG100 family type VII secretion target
MNQINLTHGAFDQAKRDVAAGVEKLRTDRDRIDERVSGFLGTGWVGSAADTFVDGWADWKVGADNVLQGLDAMGQLLDAAHRDFIASDEGSQASLDQLSSRLIDRLGD